MESAFISSTSLSYFLITSCGVSLIEVSEQEQMAIIDAARK
jgi:hypothetical protein